MKYDQVNWLEWPGCPSEQVFNDWVKARKSKKHPVLTHTAMKKYSKHVFKAISEGVCTLEEAFEYACEGGWRAIMYQYLVSAKSREMDMMTMAPAVSDGYIPAPQPRSTREMSFEEEMSTGWAL